MSKLFSKINLFYSIDYKTEDNSYIFCGIESSQNEKLAISEFIKLKNISWKLLFSLLNKVKSLWRMKRFNNELTLDSQSLSKIIFSKLMSCEENINLRNKNTILENEINTEFQTLLFDFLYEEQELYEYYDELFDKKKYKPKNTKIPFSSFITDYQSLFVNIYNDDKKIKRLKKLRWYCAFDKDNFLTISPSMLFSFYESDEQEKQNNDLSLRSSVMNNNLFFEGNNLSLYETDSFNEKEKDDIYKNFINNNELLNIKNEIKDCNEIILNHDIMNSLLDKEDNPLLYIVKLISITMTLFCRETMLYLNVIYDGKKSVELIKAYIKRFNNFVQAAKIINSQCENINVVMNYLDKDILNNYPHFPKFSIFRLCIKIWFNEMSSILTEDNSSILTKIKNSTKKLYSDFIYEDLINIKDSFQSFLSGSGNISNIFCKSKGNFNLSTSISLFNSNSNNQTIASTICPFGSFYEDSSVKYTIIEKSLGIIYETFSDEYSVYLFNLSNIEANNYYEEIENDIIDIINSCIRNLWNNNINNNININININEDDNQSTIKTLIDKILKYFKNYFYSQRIINKLKRRIYSTVIHTLKNLIFEQIEIKIKAIISNLNKKNNQIDNIEVKLNEKYIIEIEHYLSENNIKVGNEIKTILNKINNIEIFFDILADLDKWLEKEFQNFDNVDKKVKKELENNNISSHYNSLQRYLLSFSIKNSWETIRKIRTIENYHQKINNNDENNKRNSNIKQSINVFSANNNLDNFYSDDLNNFGNIDYFAEENNDTNNNNFININNNANNAFSGFNNLRNSNFFFG